MFLDSLLSSNLLIFGSGCSLYLLINESFKRFSRFRLEVLPVTIGVLAICYRSVFNVISPIIFNHTYPIDPRQIELECLEISELRLLPVHLKVVRIISITNISLGMFMVCNCQVLGMYFLTLILTLESLTDFTEETFNFLWLVMSAFISTVKGNYFFYYACFPYALTFWALPPEKNCTWTAKRIINNYSMLAYVLLLTEGIRESWNYC